MVKGLFLNLYQPVLKVQLFELMIQESGVVKKRFQETSPTCENLQFSFLDLRSLDFPIVLCTGQSNECSQTNHFYADKDKVSVVFNDHH